MALRLKRVPALQGALWVRRGLRTFALRPLGYASLLVAFFFATMVASLVLPLVGSVVSLMALPLLSLGAMIGTQSALRGGQVHPGQLIEPLRQPGPRRGTLLRLCVLYGGLTMLVLLVTEWAMGDALQQLQAAYEGQTDPRQAEVAADPRLLQALGLQALLVSLLSVPFWHAPALVAWAGQGVGQALFSSTLAVWRCKGAFLVYGLVWGGLVLILGTAAALLATLFGVPRFAAVAALPLALLAMTAFYASLYFTFIDSFELDDPAAPPVPPEATA